MRNVSTATALTTAGVVSWHQHSVTELEASHSMQQPLTSLIIPTLEATIRAQRLVYTAFMVVYDYESAKLRAYLGLEQDSTEKVKWLEERSKRQEALEKSQKDYTDESYSSGLEPGEYRKIKLAQRQEVLTAAERLADAEEVLEKIGGNEVHLRAANRLLQLCQKNGGVYIKIGQHLANLDYLIPKEYINVLSTLFDAAPLTPYEDVCKVIEEDLGASPDKLFDSFEKEPIASASLAQVHVAYDKDSGEKLAVKVQHRGLRETSSGDVFAITTVIHILDFVFEDFTWMWIAEEIAPQLPKELDFCNEGKNSEKAKAAIEKSGLDCVVPKVIWKDTSERVLCMEFEEGFKATDTEAIEEAGLNKHDIAKLIASVFNEQVFIEGFVHCDPHPANLMIRKQDGGPFLVLLDHGLYKQLDDDFRIQYARLWRNLMMADVKGIKESCRALGVDEMYTLFAAMLTSRPFDEIVERSKTGSLKADFQPDSKSDKAMIQGYAQRFLKDIFGILSTVPRQMLLLLKMNDCLRHIDYTLGSPLNNVVAAGKYASIAVYDDERKNARGIRDRLRAWFDYVRVMLRIQAHDFGVWTQQRISNSRFSLLNQ
jgi:aarF domain-containing kinase